MVSDKQVEFLLKLRDGAQMIADATNEYLESLAPAGIKREKAVSEEIFTVLKFDVMQGAKIGEYEVAYKTTNDAEKWTQASDILKNATIKDRYHGAGYAYSYWFYSGKIYRQKLKAR